MEMIKVFGWLIWLMVISVAIGCITLSPAVRVAFADDLWQSAVDGNINTPATVRNVGIGTTAPRAKFHISNGAFLVEGDQGTIDLDNLGPGPRLMWLPSLAAFRVGNLYTADLWALNNIGEESLGLGPDSVATDLGSIAIAYGSTSSGRDSVSIGSLSSALFDGDVAIGPNTKAGNITSDGIKEGRNAVAIGYAVSAKAEQSIAIGMAIANSFPTSLMIGFHGRKPPALFADGSGVIINGTPGETETRYPLAVRGAIKAEEIIVDTNWADYVFQEDYQLPPLEQVAAYIRENKRLPEVPSEGQIKKGGLKMGDMMALQMKKIEELTLYAIQLKQQNDQLKQENRDLKTQKDALQDHQKRLEQNQQVFSRRLQALESALAALPGQ